MFERFTRDARTVVDSTQELCRSLGTDEVRPVHLLLALTEDDSGACDVLAAHGLTADAVADTLGAPRPAPPAPLGDDDAWAARRRFGLGGRLRFGRGSKKVLELSLREALRTGAREIRTEHIALGVLRADDEAVTMLLRSLGTDPRAVRADLENRGRRSA